MVERETVEAPAGSTDARARLTASERRHRIIAAARSEFARVGFQGASTASIARRAGCSEPMLYKHFTGKRELYLEALRSSIARFQSWFDDTVEPHRDVRDQARSIIAEQMRDPEFLDLQRLRMLGVSLADDAEVRDTLLEADRGARERVAQLVLRGQDQGVIRQDVDPDYVAWTWIALMLASCYSEALAPGSFAEMGRLVERFIATIDIR